MNEDHPIAKRTHGRPLVNAMCSLFFILALVGIFVLIITDIQHHLTFTTLHQHLDAWPLTMIGLAYITLQFALKQSMSEKIKGGFLGVAFLLWGGEQLLPVSRVVTLMDEGAVTIFVVDVSIIIWSHLNIIRSL